MKKQMNRDAAISSFYAASDEALFTQDIIAAVLDCSEAKLERDRWAGNGIPYIKFERFVRYRKSDCLAWLNAHEVRTSTTVSKGRN